MPDKLTLLNRELEDKQDELTYRNRQKAGYRFSVILLALVALSGSTLSIIFDLGLGAGLGSTAAIIIFFVSFIGYFFYNDEGGGSRIPQLRKDVRRIKREIEDVYLDNGPFGPPPEILSEPPAKPMRKKRVSSYEDLDL